jgi:hypothetical protein
VSRRSKDGHPVEDILAAITSYAKVLLSADYRWTQAWTLYEFLTRHQNGDRKGPLQLVRFTPDNFDETRYLTSAAKTGRQQQKTGPTDYERTKTQLDARRNANVSAKQTA